MNFTNNLTGLLKVLNFRFSLGRKGETFEFKHATSRAIGFRFGRLLLGLLY